MNTELKALLKQIESLPYGRNSVRANYLLVPKENKGTCSTKHAYVKHIALQKKWENVKLFIGIYLMNSRNTSGVGKILDQHGLEAIPEAHSYLKIDGVIKDITGLNPPKESFEKSLQIELEISPDQIGDFKLDFHKSFIYEWTKNHNFTAQELWNIREKCIHTLTII